MKTVQEYLGEARATASQVKKAQKILDDVMNSEDGNKLSVAWNDGDEGAAEDVLTRRKIKGKDLKHVLALMGFD